MTAASINEAAPQGANDKDPALIAKAEALLDRAHFSPGEIDGADGDDFRNAVRAFQAVNGLAATGELDADTWNALAPAGSAPVVKTYTISDSDVAGPFTKAIPAHSGRDGQASGPFVHEPARGARREIPYGPKPVAGAQPARGFRAPRTEIMVADVPPLQAAPRPLCVRSDPAEGPSAVPIAATIVVDKPGRTVRAYDQDGKFLAFYPATIGSEEKPAPSGVFKVKSVDWNPEYHYDPKFAWKEVKTKRKLTVQPGPNNPVGLVWIDLTAPSYGIHGTPAPEAIGHTESHGCIRLTNWDAADLAAMARPGTVVRFDDQNSPVARLLVPLSEGQRPEAKAQTP